MWAQRLAETKTAVVFSLLTAEQNVQFLQAAAAHAGIRSCFLLGDLVGRQLFEAPHGIRPPHLSVVWQPAIEVARRHPRVQHARRRVQVADGPIGGCSSNRWPR